MIARLNFLYSMAPEPLAIIVALDQRNDGVFRRLHRFRPV